MNTAYLITDDSSIKLQNKDAALLEKDIAIYMSGPGNIKRVSKEEFVAKNKWIRAQRRKRAPKPRNGGGR